MEERTEEESICKYCRNKDSCPIEDGSDVEMDSDGNVFCCPEYKENEKRKNENGRE